MWHPTHWVMYAKHIVNHSGDKIMVSEFEEDSEFEELEKKIGDESEEQE